MFSFTFLQYFCIYINFSSYCTHIKHLYNEKYLLPWLTLNLAFSTAFSISYFQKYNYNINITAVSPHLSRPKTKSFFLCHCLYRIQCHKVHNVMLMQDCFSGFGSEYVFVLYLEKQVHLR